MPELPIPPVEKKSEEPTSLDSKRVDKDHLGDIRAHLREVAIQAINSRVVANFKPDLLKTTCADHIIDRLASVYAAAEKTKRDPVEMLSTYITQLAENKGDILSKLFENYAKEVQKHEDLRFGEKLNDTRAQISVTTKDGPEMREVFIGVVAEYLRSAVSKLKEYHMTSRLKLEDAVRASLDTTFDQLDDSIIGAEKKEIATEPKEETAEV